MRTIPVALALVACALPGQAIAGPGSAPDERAAGGGYQTYVACSTKASAKPAHSCKSSQPKAAFFVSTKHDATYKVCVKFPGKKKRLCASAQPADKGEKRFVTIATAKTGKHRVAWYVEGAKVGSWTFDVTAG
jgi:hypothetical protein